MGKVSVHVTHFHKWSPWQINGLLNRRFKVCSICGRTKSEALKEGTNG